MRNVYYALFIVFSNYSFLFSQVPNGGFENWTAGEPNYWMTNNFETYITTTQSNNSHSSTSALNG